MVVLLWVFLGVAGLAVLAVPAVRLWQQVHVLGREVARVARELSEAGAALDRAAGDLSGRAGDPRG